MAEKKPLVMVDGARQEMPVADSIPLANMPKGGLLPLTSCYRFPIGSTWIMEDESNPGTYVRIKFDNGYLDQVPCDINGTPL